MTTVAFAGLVLVGGWQIRGAPFVALLALGALAFLFTVAEARLSGDLDRATLLHTTTRYVRVALVLLAAVGAFVLLEDLELVAGIAVMATWWKVGRLPRWPRPPAESAEDLQRLVRELDGPALAQAWADCQPREGIRSSAEIMRISQHRQVVLDELERRDPAGFAAWLERGAPADDPPAAGLSRP